MKIFVYDTETTWFINKKETDLKLQPQIVQFAWILWELNAWVFTEEKRINILINPEKPIPFWACKKQTNNRRCNKWNYDLHKWTRHNYLT